MSNLQRNKLTSYMDVNFNKYSNVSFLTFVYTVFISSKNHIQVLNRSSNAGAALVKLLLVYVNETYVNVTLAFERCCVTKMRFTRVCMVTLRVCFKYLKSNVL